MPSDRSDPDAPVSHAPEPLLLLVVAVGGVLGSLGRYGLGVARPGLLTTLVVNVLGSFLLGLLVGLRPHGRWSRPFLGTGVLGGFTTFSTFSYETLLLVEDGHWTRAAVYALGSLALGLAAVAAGASLGASLAASARGGLEQL